MKNIIAWLLIPMCLFEAYGHEDFIRINPGPKREVIAVFNKNVEWLLYYEPQWEEVESVKESFLYKTPPGPSMERKNIAVLKEPFMLNGKIMMSRLDGEKDFSWKLIDEEGNDCGGVNLYWSSSVMHLQRLLLLLADPCPGDSTGSMVGYREKLENGGLWCLYSDEGEKEFQFKCSMQGNLGLGFYWNRDDDSRKKFHEEDARELFRLLRGEAVCVSPGDKLQPALEKRTRRLAAKSREVEEMLALKRKNKEEIQKKEENARELEKWETEPCYGMPPLCDKAMAYDSSQAPVELLKHEESLSTQLVSPNIHQGRITLDMLKKWGGKLFQVKSEGCRRNGVHVDLAPSGDMEKRMEKGSHVEILVAYARNRKEAMELLLKVRFYDPRKTNRDPRDVAASTVIKPGKVGDFDLGCGPVLGSDGALVKGSDQSAVYFLRGNTAVMVLSTDPGYSVLGLARKLDAVLNGKKGSAVSESK